MLQELYLKRHSYAVVPFRNSYTRLTPVESVENGVVVRSSQFKEYSPIDSDKEITMFDYSIGNLLAVGGLNKLRPVSMINHDVDGISSHLDSLVKTAENVPAE